MNKKQFFKIGFSFYIICFLIFVIMFLFSLITIQPIKPIEIKQSKMITIQEMIDKANPGDIIIIPPGLYDESIRITKPLTLQGTDKTNTKITCSAKDCSTINIVQPNVTIRNLDINNLNSIFGIVWQENAPYGLIENCVLHIDTLLDDTKRIALCIDATNVTIRYCDFYDCADEMIVASLSNPADDLLIENCTFHDMNHSHTVIEIQTGNNITIKNCSFTNVPSSFVFGIGWKDPTTNMIIDECKLSGDFSNEIFQIINTKNIVFCNSIISGKRIGIRVNSDVIFKYCIFTDDINFYFEDYSNVLFECPTLLGEVVWFVEENVSYVIRTCPFAEIKSLYSTPTKPSFEQPFTITVDVDNIGDIFDYLWCKIYQSSKEVYCYITNELVADYSFIYNSSGISTPTIYTVLTGHGSDIYSQYDDSQRISVFLSKPYFNYIIKNNFIF